jgi:uncharacterized integral membrane protein
VDPPADQRSTLSADLREVRTRPERAFNLGAALGLTLAVATFVFLVQNSGRTEFDFLWFEFTLPLWIALLGALVVGALLILTALAVHHRRRRRIGRRERAAGRLEEALSTPTPEPDPPRPAGRGAPTRPGPMGAQPD